MSWFISVHSTTETPAKSVVRKAQLGLEPLEDRCLMSASPLELSVGPPSSSIGMLLPAVQKVRQAAARIQTGLLELADRRDPVGYELTNVLISGVQPGQSETPAHSGEIVIVSWSVGAGNGGSDGGSGGWIFGSGGQGGWGNAGGAAFVRFREAADKQIVGAGQAEGNAEGEDAVFASVGSPSHAVYGGRGPGKVSLSDLS